MLIFVKQKKMQTKLKRRKFFTKRVVTFDDNPEYKIKDLESIP